MKHFHINDMIASSCHPVARQHEGPLMMSSVLKMELKKMPEFWDFPNFLANGFCWKTTMGLRGGNEWCHLYVTMSHTPFYPFFFLSSQPHLARARTEKQCPKGSPWCFPSSRSATDLLGETMDKGRVDDLRGVWQAIFCWTLLCSLHYYLFCVGGGWGLGPQQSCCDFMSPAKPIQHLIQVF